MQDFLRVQVKLAKVYNNDWSYKDFAEVIKANKDRLFNLIYTDMGFDAKIDQLVKAMTEGADK